MIPGGLDVLLPHGRCRQRCMCPGESAYVEHGALTRAVCVELCGEMDSTDTEEDWTNELP